MYEKSFHKKLVDIIKNKWIMLYKPNRDGTLCVYYITGVRDNEWGGKALNGYRIILNEDDSFSGLDLLKDYDISLDNILYSVEVENKESIEFLNLQLAKHILL